MLTTNTFGSVGNRVNEEFRAALKVALADGEINKAEQEKLNEIRNRSSSNNPISTRANPSKGFQLDDREFGLAQKLIKAIITGNKDKANKALSKLSEKLDLGRADQDRFYFNPIRSNYSGGFQLDDREFALAQKLIMAILTGNKDKANKILAKLSEKLDLGRADQDRFYFNPIRSNYSKGFQLDDREFDLAKKLIKAILTGNKDKANKILAKLTEKLNLEHKTTGNLSDTKSHDPIIDAYDTALADGAISKEEVATLKELVEA
jgi:tellurite resistance protein